MSKRRRPLLLVVSAASFLVACFVWLQLKRDEPKSVGTIPASGSRRSEPPTLATDTTLRHELPTQEDLRSAATSVVRQQVQMFKDEARGIAETLVARFPEDPRCHDVLAGVQYRLCGNASTADELWKTAIKLDPKFLAPYFGRMNIAWSQGDFDAVVEFMRDVLHQKPSSLEARRLLASALIESGRFEEAIESLKPLGQAAPDSVSSYLLLGKACMQLDDYSKAAEYFEGAVRLNPKCREGHYGLAQAYQRLARGEEARHHLEKSQSLKADGSSQDDRSAYERLIESDATLVRQEVIATCLAAGEICQRHGDVERAESYWLRVMALDPRDSRARQSLQRLYDQPGPASPALDTPSQERPPQSDSPREG